MKLVLLVPQAIRRFISEFPQTWNNGYRYFNYDNRVVNERVNRGDSQVPYQGPDQFTDREYSDLVTYAKSQMNPILAKYSKTVAAEDAMNMAIRSYMSGKFDAKINANKFAVLVNALKQGMDPIIVVGKTAPPVEQGRQESPAPVKPPVVKKEPVKAPPKKEKTPLKVDKGPKPLELSKNILRQMGVKPHEVTRQEFKHQAPRIVRDKGVVKLVPTKN